MWFQTTIRIRSKHFKPLGTDFPHPKAADVAQLRANVEFFDRELIRWRDSIAWVNDEVRPAEVLTSRQALVDIMVAIATDSNATAVNEQLKHHLSAYDTYSCYIVRDSSTLLDIIKAIAMSRVTATQQLIPIVKDDVAALYQLKSVSAGAKNTVLGMHKGKEALPWTRQDIERESAEVAELRKAYDATRKAVQPEAE